MGRLAALRSRQACLADGNRPCEVTTCSTFTLYVHPGSDVEQHAHLVLVDPNDLNVDGPLRSKKQKTICFEYNHIETTYLILGTNSLSVVKCQLATKKKQSNRNQVNSSYLTLYENFLPSLCADQYEVNHTVEPVKYVFSAYEFHVFYGSFSMT
jgi:hypothetical protein